MSDYEEDYEEEEATPTIPLINIAPFYMIMAGAELGTIWMILQLMWSPVPASVYALQKPTLCNDPINCVTESWSAITALDTHELAVPVMHF